MQHEKRWVIMADQGRAAQELATRVVVIRQGLAQEALELIVGRFRDAEGVGG